jgi:hypothetical protein
MFSRYTFEAALGSKPSELPEGTAAEIAGDRLDSGQGRETRCSYGSWAIYIKANIALAPVLDFTRLNRRRRSIRFMLGGRGCAHHARSRRDKPRGVKGCRARSTWCVASLIGAKVIDVLASER